MRAIRSDIASMSSKPAEYRVRDLPGSAAEIEKLLQEMEDAGFAIDAPTIAALHGMASVTEPKYLVFVKMPEWGDAAVVPKCAPRIPPS